MYVFCGHDGMKPHLAEVWTLEVDDVRGHMAKGLEDAKANQKQDAAEGKKEEEEED